MTPWTAACQAPLSMGFPRQEYWSALPFPSAGDLSNPGIEPMSLALQVGSLPLSHQESPTVPIPEEIGKDSRSGPACTSVVGILGEEMHTAGSGLLRTSLPCSTVHPSPAPWVKAKASFCRVREKTSLPLLSGARAPAKMLTGGGKELCAHSALGGRGQRSKGSELLLPES